MRWRSWSSCSPGGHRSSVVILATRHDPPLGLHRLPSRRRADRGAGRRPAVHGSTRRGELLAAAGIELSDDAVASLLARTEGWAAGLRLAALSLAGHPDPERFVAEFSGSERTVADYLLAEVLERQPERGRQLLLRTSILERVSGPLADRLIGATGSERILLELEDANAFVVSIDPERSWFRYHQLFADLLRLELRRTEPDAVPKLHHAAAEWYAEHGLVDRRDQACAGRHGLAVRRAISSGDTASASRSTAASPR